MRRLAADIATIRLSSSHDAVLPEVGANSQAGSALMAQTATVDDGKNTARWA
jgi:hypothetical protein